MFKIKTISQSIITCLFLRPVTTVECFWGRTEVEHFVELVAAPVIQQGPECPLLSPDKSPEPSFWVTYCLFKSDKYWRNKKPLLIPLMWVCKQTPSTITVVSARQEFFQTSLGRYYFTKSTIIPEVLHILDGTVIPEVLHILDKAILSSWTAVRTSLTLTLRLEWQEQLTKIKRKQTRYRLTRDIPWSVWSCHTGQLLFSSKQFNDINITVVASFVFLMLCHFKRGHFSHPHSSTKVG